MRAFWLFFVVLMPFFECYAEIRTTETLDPIICECEKSDSDTLVLLDIGGTLLAFKDPILHKAHEKWTKEWFHKNYPNITKEETVQLVRVVEAAHTNWELIDAAWPQAITQAQAKGVKVVALTKVLGLHGERSKMLAAFGISLKNDLPELSSGELFAYHEGVIETEAPLKGPVLDELLEHIAKKPKKIIFVDDRLEQIKSIDESCLAHAIPCLAFHYTATIQEPALDPVISDYKLHTLVKEHRWPNTIR